MRLKHLAVALVASVPLVLPVAPAGAAENVDCYEYAAQDPPGEADAAHVPYDLLGVPEAHELFDRRDRTPGAGIRVAVLDSGVTPQASGLEVAEATNLADSRELVDPHGTIVAGLIAGDRRDDGRLTGVAPGAEIVDVRVYDQADPQDGEVGVETSRVVAGLEWVGREARRLDIRIVNVSLAVARTTALERAVEALRRKDVIVVAATGNRPAEGDELFAEYGERAPGQDALQDVHPAGLDDVLAVNATAGGAFVDGTPVDPLDSVLPNSMTDVAVPTAGGVSHALNGGTCVVTGVATSWAAAEVSGLVALLWSWFPTESDEQILARLVETADGTTAGPTTLTGAGVVQPVEAMTRELTIGRDGTIERAEPEASRIPRATAPDPAVDPLELARDRAVWWGLLGGAVLVLALLLRPILARRR
ncbi:MAG: S8 family serine peptidase [Nocardioides sp.]